MVDDVYRAPEHSGPEQNNRTEPEMQSHSGAYLLPKSSSGSRDWLAEILREAFIAQPLIGNVLVSPDERRGLHEMATAILKNALNLAYLSDYGLSDIHNDILVLETVLLLRGWNDVDGGRSDEHSATNFWEYICNQYALSYDERFGNSHAYKIFRTAVKKSLKRHKRLFAATRQKYYTTLLIHALAPKVRFYALFEQIFAFYAETLNYQYIKGDPAFRAFSYAMKKRFDSGRAVANESVYIKSMQSSSAIQELFSRCPEYMGGFVERAVFAIDTLVASGAIAETSYVDALLSGWYDNRSREERTVAKRARSKAGTDRVVTEFSNIRAAYRHEDGRVSLVIPSIRLGEQADNPPWITVYRYPGDDTPYADKLRYYGDYFCITSRREAIPLEALLPEQGERMEPRVVISHGGRDIYDSGTRLFRDFIAFDDGGAETTKRPDREYVNLFIAKGGTVRGEDSSPDYTASVCGGGHLYRVLIDDATFLSVNGTNVFPVEKMVSGLTLNMSVAPVSHCRYFDGQRECAVFTAPTTLTVTSERESVEKQYRVVVDESPLSLSDCGRAEGGFRVPLPHERGVHELRIVENASNRRIYTLYYVVIEGFSLDFSGFYFYDNFPENGCLEVADSTGRARYPYKLSPGQDAMHVPYREGELSVSIPALSCRLDGKPLSPGGQTIWHDDIAMSALLEVDVPRGYTCVTVVGQRMFPSARVEFGNEIRAGHAADVEAVGLLIRKNDEPPLQIKLFDVAFEARFASAPLLAERDGLLWCVEGNYIGGQESEFEVSLGRKGLEIGRYHVGLVDELIPLDRPLEDGVYDYTVFLKSSGFFSKAEELVHGHFFVGDPALVRFDDCAVIVTEAILESDRVPLKPASGILTKLRYIGERGLNGETQPYPCYEGCLQYRHNGDLRPYATREFEYGGIFREQVNPVRLWLINEYTISLRGPLDDGLYVSRKWESITDRTPPAWKNSRAAGETDYCNPDYYSFQIIPLSEVLNV